MKRKVFVAGGVLFIIGLFLGALSGLHRLEASFPEDEISPTEIEPDTFWHEHWKAAEAYVSSARGYQEEGLLDFDGDFKNRVSAHSGRMVKDGAEAEIEVYPDMVVTKWKVHGHIHFQ